MRRTSLVPVLAILPLLSAACSNTTVQEASQVSRSDTVAPVPSPPAPEGPTPSPHDDRIRLESPVSGQTVASPLVVRGRARGPWYFEASFPVRLMDAAGRVLAIAPAQAQGEWMTTEFVPFEVSLSFAKPPPGEGRLVLEKSNASGLPEHADSLVVPVRFP